MLECMNCKDKCEACQDKCIKKLINDILERRQKQKLQNDNFICKVNARRYSWRQ